MKTFKQWLASSTVEVKSLPEFGQKLAYAMYKQRTMHDLRSVDQYQFNGNMIGFNVPTA